MDAIAPLLREDAYEAVNTAAATGNAIHGDGAMAYGYRRGLVPGVALLAYACETLRRAESEGLRPLARIALTYVAPVYDGEQIVVRLRADGARHDLELVAPGSRLAAHGSASIDPTGYGGRRPRLPEAPAPAVRWPMTAHRLVEVEHLGSIDLVLAADDVVSELSSYGVDPRPYLEDERVPIASLAQSYFRLSDVNLYRPGPSILAGHDFLVVDPPRLGTELSLRARVDRLFTRSGRRYVTFELGWFDCNHNARVWALHTSVYDHGGETA